MPSRRNIKIFHMSLRQNVKAYHRFFTLVESYNSQMYTTTVLHIAVVLLQFSIDLPLVCW